MADVFKIPFNDLWLLNAGESLLPVPELQTSSQGSYPGPPKQMKPDVVACSLISLQPMNTSL